MTKYEEYALLQKEIDVLDAKKELLRAEIEKILPEEGFKDEVINAYWTTKSKYEYYLLQKVYEFYLICIHFHIHQYNFSHNNQQFFSTEN